MDVDLQIKIALIGDSMVGKTSLVKRICKGEFSTSSIPTIGQDIFYHNTEINGIRVKFIYFDTAGQERMKAFTTSSLHGTDVVLLMYDITKKDTFTNALNMWRKQIVKDCNAQIMLIGNKSDLEAMREVQQNEAMNESQINKMVFAEISCKTGDCVQQILNETVKIKTGTIECNRENLSLPSNYIDLNKQKKGCC